jgi:hypothetical protein
MPPLAGKFRRSPVKPLTKALSVPWAERFACAIRSTESSSPGSHAWFAAERRPTLITFGLFSPVRWGAVSVTSSQYRYVASITESFTARVTRRHGGVSSPSILSQSRSSCGSTRGSMARPPRSVEAPSLDLQPQRKRPSKAQPPRPLIQASMRGVPPAKLSMAPQANDLVSTGRGQSRQCAQEHRSENRSLAAGGRAKCGSARVDRRNRYCRSGRHRRPTSFEAAIIADYDARSRRARAGAPACIGVMLANATSTEMITIPRSKALT